MTDADHVTILIADDHPLFRGALAQAVASRIAGAQVLEAEDFGAAQRILDARPGLDLCLLDINMPGMRGFTGLLYMRAQYPDIPVMIVSAIEDEEVIRAAFHYGAAGSLPKSLSVEEIGTGRLRLQLGARYDWAHYVPRDTTAFIFAGGQRIPVRPRTFGVTAAYRF